jgi:D-isomer specific 2-hydroxyacid dehydrogenase, NAD binding domain
VAEHAVLLALALTRNIIPAASRVREGNYTLNGLVGSEMRSKTVGVMGTGAIGSAAAKIFKVTWLRDQRGPHLFCSVCLSVCLSVWLAGWLAP